MERKQITETTIRNVHIIFVYNAGEEDEGRVQQIEQGRDEHMGML